MVDNARSRGGEHAEAREGECRSQHYFADSLQLAGPNFPVVENGRAALFGAEKDRIKGGRGS